MPNQTTISSSNLNAGNNLNITSNQDTTIIASNLNAGTADTTPNQTDSTIQGQVNITAKNLNILADIESDFSTYENKSTRTLSFNNWNQGNISTKIINSQLTSKNNTNFNFNITDKITTSYNSKDFNANPNSNPSPNNHKTTNNSQLTTNNSPLTTNNNSPLTTNNYLTYLKQNKSSQTLFNPIEEQQKQWADATRGLTGAGTALIVIGVVVVSCVLTACTAAPAAGAAGAGAATATTTITAASVGSTMATAVATTAASTAAISATNTSMNLDGDIFKQAKGIGKQTLRDTTSKQALESYAIAGGTVLLTMGLTAGFDKIATTTTNTTATVANTAANTRTATQILLSKTTIALKNSLIQTISSSAVQSAVNGDSFSESLKNSTKNLLINTAGAMAANQIGQLAHGSVTVDSQGSVISYTPPVIGQTLQLTLHGILGCAMASAGGNNCASGAAAGVMGEVFAGFLDRNTNLTNTQIIEGSKLSGAITAAMVSGPDDGGSVFAGANIGRNAGENNYLMPQEKAKLVRELDDCHGDSICQKQVQVKYEKISDSRDEKLESYAYKCMAFGNCEKFDKINEDLKLTTTFEGNNYYNSLTPEQRAEQFILLPSEKAIYHNYPIENGKIDLLNQTDYKKYIHPVMGYEVVVDNKGNLVTDHLNIGTYNFYNPSGYGYNNPLITNDWNHFRYDMVPYFAVGNSLQDPSNFYERSSRFFKVK